jgi:hypothetical protein
MVSTWPFSMNVTSLERLRSGLSENVYFMMGRYFLREKIAIENHDCIRNLLTCPIQYFVLRILLIQ